MQIGTFRGAYDPIGDGRNAETRRAARFYYPSYNKPSFSIIDNADRGAGEYRTEFTSQLSALRRVRVKPR